jgi:type I restriction enzyme S subunit
MGRGRKPIPNFNGSEWETVFYNSVGTYVQCINIQLSKEYSLEPLSNHLKIVGGYAFKTAEYINQGIPIIRISDFNNEQIVLKDVVYYQDAKELDKYQLIEGDIIIALTGGTIAKLAIVQAGLGKIYLNQRVGKFQVLNPEEFEGEYIYWLARSIQSIIKNLAWGAAIPNVSPKQIEELKFPFPPKEIQRGIINFLNDLKNNDLTSDKVYFNEIIESEIISLQEKQLTTSEISTELSNQFNLVKKLRQQLLQDAVQGKLVDQNKKDEPASELLKRIKDEKQKLIAEKKLKKEKELPPIKPEEIPFDIPENWVWCRLGEICEFRNGKAHEQYIREEGKFILVTSRFVSTSGKQIKRATKMLTPLYKNEIAIVMSDVPGGRALGRAYLIERDDTYTLNQRIGGISPFIINSHYLCLSLDRNMHFLNFDDGKKQTNLRKDQILSCLVPIPPVYEQNRIVQKLDELMQFCNELEASIKESESQNEKLLQQVLREALRKEPILEND